MRYKQKPGLALRLLKKGLFYIRYMPQGLKMKAFGDNPLSRVRSVCDGSYTCERDDTDGCNGYGPSGQTQNGVLPITGCSGKMTYILLQSNPIVQTS